MWVFTNIIIAGRGSEKWLPFISGIALLGFLALGLLVFTAEPSVSPESHYVRRAWKLSELHESKHHHQHQWPDLRFGWKIVVGSILAVIGAILGSVGGSSGGSIFVPMLALIIGFDPKSSTAISKCMITGTSAVTLCYNIWQKHPTLDDLPLIDYDLALLFQPMLLLGISIGVGFNVIFPDWLITILLIILFIGMSIRSFSKGLETWREETMKKKEDARQLDLSGNANGAVETNTKHEVDDTTSTQRKRASLIEQIYWKELGLLTAVWILILALQIAKNYTTTCSVKYWILNFLQIPVGVGVSAYEAISLYTGKRRLASKGDDVTNWRAHKLVIYCVSGVLAGIVGAMLGVGGAIILGPLIFEMGIHPKVASATTTCAIFFSASIAMVEYYLLKRFPVPYALYFLGVAAIAVLVGQLVVDKVIIRLGRASIIIFVLAGMMFGAAISLGGLGIARTIKMIKKEEYMGFHGICSYGP